MSNNSIEDILIDKDFNKKNKRGKPIVILLFFLIILLVLAVVAYCFIVNKETNKELFLKGLVNADFRFFIENETYETIMKKFLNDSFEMENELTLTTTMKNAKVEDMENISKFLLKWTTVNNKEKEEKYNELNLSYADNKLINAKVIENKEQIAIISDEIVNKYVGIHKSNINSFLEKMNMQELLKKYTDKKEEISTEKIELKEEIQKQKKDEYMQLVLNKLADEKFIKLENQISLIKEGNKEVAVQAYTLSLSAAEYSNLLVEVLTTLKNDKVFLEEFIINSSEDKITNDIEELENQDISQMQAEIFLNILLGRKVNITIEDVHHVINNMIELIKNDAQTNAKQNFEMTVYVSESITEKIGILFPDKTTIDIEFNSISENEKSFVITYLYEDNATTQEDIVYSASENQILDNAFIQPQTNGIKLEIYKTQNDASTNIQTVCSRIEDKKIEEKMSLDITTKGTASSKNFNNECILTYSNNDGEMKANIKNKIAFEKVIEIEKLTEDNCLYLDSMSDIEFETTMQSITTKILEVYTNKKESLNFIDTNTQAPSISQNNVNRDELRNLLVTIVSTKMGEVQAEGRNYTLEDLLDLQIAGHIVSVVIQNDVAEVSIDGVKFKIDANFNLSDA